MTVSEATFAGAHLEIPSTIGHWKYVRTLGCGAWSAVIEAVNSATEEHLACKVVSRVDLTASGEFALFEQELRVQQFLHHPNIVSIHEVIFKPDLVFVFLDLCTAGDLLTLLTERGGLPPSDIRRISFQILAALHYIHMRGITHRDVKPENIFMTDSGTVKLGDFGLSEVAATPSKAKSSGTLIYAAPEIFQHPESVTTKADIWSFGIMLFALATGRVPWVEGDDDNIMDQISERSFKSAYLLPRDLLPLFEQCTQLDPADRPTAEELMALPFFQLEIEHLKQAFSSPNVSSPATSGRQPVVRRRSTIGKSAVGLGFAHTVRPRANTKTAPMVSATLSFV